MSGAGPVAVGVTPAEQLHRRPRLFAALEAALPVRFEGRDPGQLDGLEALLDLSPIAGLPSEAATVPRLPSLEMLVPEAAQAAAPALNLLTGVPELDPRLHASRLPDDRLAPALAGSPRLETDRETTVIAAARATSTWVRSGERRQAILAPAELGPREALRERLCGKRSAALLPLVDFLRELTERIRWQPPPARASFLLDDPNLHWPSYGFVKLAELGRHAAAHGYHVALATVPLDAWFAHPRALRALKRSSGTISLLVHGNDHDGAELGRLQEERDAVALGAQALRRVTAFQNRTGVPVERVMVPPHEACSQATLRGLRRCGFEAISMTRPYPWVEFEPHSWLARPDGAGPLVGWEPGEFVEGLPLVLRHPLAGRSPAELALRAYLGQPLVLYGHHEDLLDGPDALLEIAAEVNRLAPTRWCSLAGIAETNFQTRHVGKRLAIRLLDRSARIEIPADVDEISFELPLTGIDAGAQLLEVDGRPASLGEPLAARPGSLVRAHLHPIDAVETESVPPSRPRPLALARRFASEGRDRLQPLARRSVSP